MTPPSSRVTPLTPGRSRRDEDVGTIIIVSAMRDMSVDATA